MRRLLLPVSLAVCVAAGIVLPHNHLAARQRNDLPVSYVCPMAEHSDVIEDAPGRKCPRCGMALVPVIIDLAWSCPVHPAVVADRAGRCPLDKRDLVQVAMSKYWTCADQPRERLLSAGRCANGSARTMVREHRAHGDHNPKHGGQLFMASDKWHHIEAAHPRPDLLRVFVYDNFTQPMSVGEFSGRAVTREEFDADSGTARDLEAFPLKRARDGKSFEARIGKRQLPVRVTVKMKFSRTGPEERFDFTFDTLSKDPAPAPAFTRTPPARPAEQPSGVTAAAPVRAETSVSVSVGQATTSGPSTMTATLTPIDPMQLAAPLPSDPMGLLKVLARHEQEVSTLIQSGQLGAVYVPALQAKEAALALEAHLSGLPDRRRQEAVSAITAVVLKAWELDAYGDLGDAQKVSHAQTGFAAAIKDLHNAYGIQ